MLSPHSQALGNNTDDNMFIPLLKRVMYYIKELHYSHFREYQEIEKWSVYLVCVSILQNADIIVPG